MAKQLPSTPQHGAGPTLADVLIRQPAVMGLEYLTPFEVDTEAWRLAVTGWSPWRIMAALSLPDLESVTSALERHHDSTVYPDTLKISIMVGQLDEAIARVMTVLDATHYKFHKGSLILMNSNPADPKSDLVPVVDDGPTLDASKTVAVLLDRKAKLLGLDAPERHQHEHTLIPLPAPAQAWVAEKRAALMIEGKST